MIPNSLYMSLCLYCFSTCWRIQGNLTHLSAEGNHVSEKKALDLEVVPMEALLKLSTHHSQQSR